MSRINNNKRKNTIKYFIYVFILLCVAFISNMIMATSMRYQSSVSGEVVGFAKENRSTSYKVVFHANGGTGSMGDQTIKYGISTKLNDNLFSKSGYIFYGWNTEEDGSGTSYDDESNITISDILDDNTIDLYAKWGQKPVEVNGVFFDTITAAISANAIQADDTETVVNVLGNINDNVTIVEHMNVIIDLHGNTIKNADINAIITNKGLLYVKNGTIESSSKNNGTINNESSGNITLDSTRVLMTANGGKQAFYNNKGIAEIKNDSFFSTVSTIRSAVQNVSGGTLTVTGGTIISYNYNGLTNAGTMTIGTKNNNVDRNTVIIKGTTYGISSSTKFDFYDGSAMGTTDAVSDRGKVRYKEDGHELVYKDEVIDGTDYIVAYLYASASVTFDPTGGVVNEPVRGVEKGDKIGVLPVPEKSGHIFDGWYTSEEGGTQITEDTVITDSITFYAHWIKKNIASVNGVVYPSIQSALNNIPDNTKTTITLIDNTQEYINVLEKKDIIIDLNGYDFSNFDSSHTLIKNYGTIEVKNGTMNTNAGSAAIDNEITGKLKVINLTIHATGQKQAIYNNGGHLLITGNSYLYSEATGIRENENLERATVQNIGSGTIVITGGTIVGKNQQAISNEGSLTIGTKNDGNIDTSVPEIIGNTYGIVSLGTINFYDGVIKGITGSINGTVDDIETNTQIKDGIEVIGVKTYYTAQLEIIP